MAVDILKTTMVEKLPSDLEGMEASMERLLALIDDVYKYVDSVVVRQILVPELLTFSRFFFFSSDSMTISLLRKDRLCQIMTLGDL